MQRMSQIFLWAGEARAVGQAQLSQEEARRRLWAGPGGAAGSPNDPFMWWGSMPPMPPIGPSEPGPIGN